MGSSSIARFAGFAALGLAGLAVSSPRLSGFLTSEAATRAVAPVPTGPQRKAIFAGGCFWSMQKAFDGVPGVASVTAGYAGGARANPTYEEVETGTTGHAESVEVIYDPGTISYPGLLDIYWHHIDPLTPNAAFCDHGTQYRSIIFYGDPEQQRLADSSKRALDRSQRFATPIVTAIQPATPFYPAEEYHQQFYKKNPAHYEAYRIGCRRDQRIRQLWGDDASQPKGATR